MDALVAEVMKKAAVVWLAVGATPAFPVWCLASGDALHVVTGPGEQPAPGLVDAATVTVTARGDHGGAVATWDAAVERVEPGTEAWAAVAPTLAAKRLNEPGPSTGLADRWARECALLRLVPLNQGL